MGDWEARLAGYTEDQQQHQQQQQQQHNVADGTVAAPPNQHSQHQSQPQQPNEQQQTWDNLGDVMHVDWGAWGWHEQPQSQSQPQQSQQPSSQQEVSHHQNQATETPASGGGGSITSPASAARYLQEAFFAHSHSSQSQSHSQPQSQAGPSIPMDAGAGGTHHRPVPHRGHTMPSLPMDQPTEEGDRFAWFDQHLPHALNHPTHSRLSVSSALAYEAPSMSAPAPPPPSSSSTPAQTPVLPRPISPLSAFLQDHFGQPPPPPPPHTHSHGQTQAQSGSTFTPPSRAFVPPGVPVPSQQPKRGRTDVHPRSQSHSRPSSRSANRAAAAAGSGGPSPSSTSSSPVGARGPSTPYTPINHPTASSSSTSNATPASASAATGRGAVGRTGEGYGEGAGGGGQTDPPSPTGTVTVEEDRRLRNTAASAKFRQKRKHYVERLHREVDELTGRREVLYHEVEELKKENGFLKKMVQLKLGFQLPSSTSDPSSSSAATAPGTSGGSGTAPASGLGYDPNQSSTEGSFDFDQVGLGQMPPQVPQLSLGQIGNYLDAHSQSHTHHTDDFLLSLPPAANIDPSLSDHPQSQAQTRQQRPDKGKGKRRKSAGG